MANCKNGVVTKSLNSDGRVYGIDLLKSSDEVVVEGRSESPIHIGFYRESAKQLVSNGNRRKEIFNLDWNYSVIIANGDLIEIMPEILYKKTPPLSGYSDRWQLSNTSFRVRNNEFGGASHEDDRHFYLKLNNDVYARLSIRFKPVGSDHDDHQNEGQLNYSVNMDGSHIVRSIDKSSIIKYRTKQKRNNCTEYVRRTERKINTTDS